MTILLGCPVSCAHRRAVHQCAFKGELQGTTFCRLARPLFGDSLRSARDRLPSKSLTFRQRRSMSRCLTTGATGDSGTQSQPSDKDLLVVGPGVLGSYVGILWQQQHPSATVVGQTNSTANHARYCRAATILEHYMSSRIMSYCLQVAANAHTTQDKGGCQ